MNSILWINLSAYVLLLAVVLGFVLFVVRKVAKALECFIEKYVPSEKFVTVKITKECLEDLAEEYKFEVKDYPKLLNCIRRNIWNKVGYNNVSPMELALCDVLTVAEEKGIVVNLLEDELLKEMIKSQADDSRDPLDRKIEDDEEECPKTSFKGRRSIANAEEESEIFRKFGLKDKGEKIPIRKCNDKTSDYPQKVVENIKVQFHDVFTGKESMDEDQEYPDPFKADRVEPHPEVCVKEERDR